MKRITHPGLTLACGGLLGFAAALGLGAGGEKPKADPPKNWSKVQVVTYPSGVTGFFDGNTGTLYLYDLDLNRCTLARRISSLGDPLLRP